MPTSWSSHGLGRGCDVTVNSMGLLSIIVGASTTAKTPEVAPVGIVMAIELFVPEVTVTADPFRRTELLPCDTPNPVPEMVT